MKTIHATETQLALLQTGELGLMEGWRVRWHVNGCERCGNELAAFEEVRAVLESEAGHLPVTTDWRRLAAEMTANIHLGVEAGECVRSPVRTPAESLATAFSWQAIWRPGLAIASVVVMLSAGAWVLTSKIGSIGSNAAPSAEAGVVLQARPGTLEIRSNGAAFSLVRASAATADISLGSGGSLQARDIDEDTGQVTIYHVYAQ